MSDVKNEVSPDETVLDSSESAEPEDDFNPFSELKDDYKPSQLKRVIAEDGLPVTVLPDRKNDIPPLSPQTLVCMADTSSFVTRDGWGNITASYKPSEVQRSPNGLYFVEVDGRKQGVLPIRPACQHYVRQMMGFEHNADHDAIYRLCAARRTTEGTFMTVRDAKVSACSMRQPRDLVSEKLLDDFDEKKVEQGKQREFFSIFTSKA